MSSVGTRLWFYNEPLIDHDSFLSSQVIVLFGIKFEIILLMELLRMGTFSLKSFLWKALFGSDKYSLFYNARLGVHTVMGSYFKVESCIDYLMMPPWM